MGSRHALLAHNLHVHACYIVHRHAQRCTAHAHAALHLIQVQCATRMLAHQAPQARLALSSPISLLLVHWCLQLRHACLAWRSCRCCAQYHEHTASSRMACVFSMGVNIRVHCMPNCLVLAAAALGAAAAACRSPAGPTTCWREFCGFDARRACSQQRQHTLGYGRHPACFARPLKYLLLLGLYAAGPFGPFCLC